MAGEHKEAAPSTPVNDLLSRSVDVVVNQGGQSVNSRVSSLRSTPGSQIGGLSATQDRPQQQRETSAKKSLRIIDTIIEGTHEDDSVYSDKNEGDDPTQGYSIPRYCVKSGRSSLSTFTVDLANVLSEIQETGDGGDSDIDGELIEELDEARRVAKVNNRLYKEENEVAEFCDRNVTMLSQSEAAKVNNDLDKYIPSVPDDWVPGVRSSDEPEFTTIDNPGNWNEYVFRPEYQSSNRNDKKYKGHFLPTGATPVPLSVDGNNRSIGKWKFFYDGKWQSSNQCGRSGTFNSDQFPTSRHGCLDVDKLKKMGLTKERMVNGDALFFYQLLLPICSPKKSGIPNDPRTPFYSEATNFTNLYACTIGLLGGQYSHSFKAVKVQELVHFDGVVVRDGALGGSNGALYQRWMTGESMHDPLIQDSITYDRFLQIKRTYKLCNNYAVPTRGMNGYDPAYKYDLIFKAMVHNCNVMTKQAELDLCCDETTFSHMGYGEANTGLLKRLGQTKPGVTRGMQTILLFDVHRTRPRVYLHRHQCHPNEMKLPSGPNEVKLLIEKLDSMLVGSDGVSFKIFLEKLYITCNNCF